MSDPRQLPAAANLRQLKNQAKELHRAWRAGDPIAIERFIQSHPKLSGQSAAEIAAAPIVLADAQLVIARELGFESWPKLKKHIESPPLPASLHELITQNDINALRETVARAPKSVNGLNEAGLPPLYTAALYRNQQSIECLLQNGATIDIFACAYLGKTTDAENLLSQNPALSRATDTNGKTGLHYAAMAGYADVAAVLLRYQADVNAVDDRGSTALMEACHAGPWKDEPADDIVELLLRHGAQVDLCQAAEMGRTDLIASILDRDGNLIDCPDDRGRTPLFHAARNNRLAAVKLLVERGADVNRSDAVGIAALHCTSQESSDELIQYLIDHGADAHLCCYVACGDESGTRQSLARNPAAAQEIFYEFNAVGFAIHTWHLGTLRILLENGCALSSEDQQHILRISNDNELLAELIAMQKR